MKFIMLLLIAAAAISAAPSIAAQCNPPLFQGYPSSCSTINLRWLNVDPIALIDRFEIYRGGALVGVTPGSAISFSETVGCEFGAVYTIRQVMKSGASCQVVTSNNPPHTKPCDLCGGSGGGGTGGGSQTPAVNIVNAASGVAGLAPDSILTAYSANLTTGLQSAGSLPLPVSLAGVSVRANGLQCGLFFADGNQVNFHLPAAILPGPVQIEVKGTDGAARVFNDYIFDNRPGVFTKNQNGQGEAAAEYLYFEQDPQSVYVVLWATGITNFNRLQTVLRINGRDYAPIYTGASKQYVGAVQLNFRLSAAMRGEYLASVRLYVAGSPSNLFDLKP